jgi:hypothetical protein
MLKRPVPPQHRSDAPIIFVHRSDPAWDNERIKAEQAEMVKREEDPSLHPVARYLGGWGRYDLDAAYTFLGKSATARDYLDEAKAPTMWHLRRHNAREWYEVHPLYEKAVRVGEKPYAAFILACSYALERVDNGPTLAMPGGRPGAADLQTLHDWGQENEIDLVYAIGEAGYQASMPLTASEKKA